LLALGSAVALMATAACSGAAGQPDSGPRELRLAHVFAVDSTQNAAAEEFADRIEEESDGQLEVTVYPSSQLGSDESLGRDLSRGTLDMAFLNPGSLASMDPLMDFHYLPYIVSDNQQADQIFYRPDGIIQQTLHEAHEKHGMTMLATFELELRGVTNSSHPVDSVDDLAGLKLRVPGSDAIRGFFDAAGAQTQVMPMGDLVSGLQTGTVDGQDNGVQITRDNGLQESQDYFTPTKHVYAIGTVVMSTEVFDSLTAEQQDLVQEVATDVAAEQVADNRARNQEYMDAIRDEIDVTELDGAQMEEFRRFGLSLWDRFADTYGQDRIDELRSEIEALR